MKKAPRRAKKSSPTSRTSSRKTSSKTRRNSRPRPALADSEYRSAKSDGDLFPIVGVGASAGGLEAFTRLVEQLPPDTGMAFVLVQHLDPEHESKLPQLLGRATNLPVLEVVNNTRVKPNHIYVIPPNRTMT